MVDVRATRPKTGDLGFLPEWDATDDKFLYRIKDKFCDRAKELSGETAPTLESLVCGQDDSRFRCHEPELLAFHRGYDPNFNYGYGPTRDQLTATSYPRRRDGGGKFVGGETDDDPKTFPHTTGTNPLQWGEFGLTGGSGGYPNDGQISPFLGTPENRRRRRRYGEWHKQDRRRDSPNERCRWIQRSVVKRIIEYVAGVEEYDVYMQNLTCSPTSVKPLLLLDDFEAGSVNRKITRSYCRMMKSTLAQDTEKEAYCFSTPLDTDSTLNPDDHTARASTDISSNAFADTYCNPPKCKTSALPGRPGYCRAGIPDCAKPNSLYGCAGHEDCDLACEECNGCSGYFYTSNKDTWNRCQFVRIHKSLLGDDGDSENRTAAPEFDTSTTPGIDLRNDLGITHAYLWDVAHKVPPNTGDGTWIPMPGDGGAAERPLTAEAALLKTDTAGGLSYVKDGAVMRICKKSNSFLRADGNIDDRVLGSADTV